MKSSLNCLMNYLIENEKPKLSAILDSELPQLLLDFYTKMRTKKNNKLHNTQSMQCMRSNLNRHFKEVRNIDIFFNARFIQANKMFKACKVCSKTAGIGVRRFTIPIDDVDMIKSIISSETSTTWIDRTQESYNK